MRKRQLLLAISAAFLGGIMMMLGVSQMTGGSTAASNVANAATSSTVSDTTTASSSPSAADIYATVRPSVVEIDVVATVSSGRFGQSQQVQGTGSGIVIDTNGDILTNNHVVEGARTIQVVFSDGATVSATVVGTDAANDLAVIKVDPSAHTLVAATLGDSSAVRIGDSVLALGNPFDLSGSLTQGIVSGLDRTDTEDNSTTLRGLIQTDAPVNPGNSGGPLLNAQGEVIGINTLIENPTGQSVNVGVAFAVSINQVKSELASLTSVYAGSLPRSTVR